MFPSRVHGHNWLTDLCVLSFTEKKIVLGSASLSYTRIALVFCNFANWSQYFRSMSDNSWTWVKWFANRTKNLERHPGMGQCLHFSFFMLTGRMLDTNWVKLFATRNLLLIFKGRSGRKGRKGIFLALCFFPWARVEISRVSRARRVRKQATIKFDQWFIYKLISYVQTSVKSYAKKYLQLEAILYKYFGKLFWE